MDRYLQTNQTVQETQIFDKQSNAKLATERTKLPTDELCTRSGGLIKYHELATAN